MLHRFMTVITDMLVCIRFNCELDINQSEKPFHSMLIEVAMRVKQLKLLRFYFQANSLRAVAPSTQN